YEHETGRRSFDTQEVLEHLFDGGAGSRAQSTGGFTEVFGSVIHLVMLAAYHSAPATYESFCQVVDVADFRDHSEAIMGQVGRLKRQGKNQAQAALLNVDDPELAKIAVERYAGMMK